MLLDQCDSSMLHRVHAGTPPRDQTLPGHRRGGRRQLSGPRRRSDRLPGAERLRQVDHHEDDYGTHGGDRRGNPVRGPAHPARSDGLQAPHGIRARRAANLCASDWPRIPDHDWPVARSARSTHHRTHRRSAAPVRPARRPARADLVLFKRHAAKSAALGGVAAQPGFDPAGRAFFGTGCGIHAGDAQLDAGARGARGKWCCSARTSSKPWSACARTW